MISLNTSRPGELKESHEDFLDNPSLQIQIAIVFGASTLEHIFNLCRGNFDFLVRLPDTLLLYIMSYLDLEDIARLSQVSHRFETWWKHHKSNKYLGYTCDLILCRNN
uniref:F-box protein 36 n=1 Tax=Laticauda laticaudata TaxID=8630 RepID=A0A8C5RCJ6_LATLA